MMKFIKEIVSTKIPAIETNLRAQIKLSTVPQIVYAIPCGNKEEKTLSHCDPALGGCGKTWMQTGKRVPGLIPVQLMIAFHNLQTPLGITTAFMLETGRLSAPARQVMTKRAIEMGGKYILYWDDDTIPEDSMALYKMYNFMERNPKAGAVSAVYCTRQDPPEPFIYKEHGKGAWWDFPMGPKAEPVPIFGAGAGFILARVEAIKDVMQQMNGDENMDTVDEIPIWHDEKTTVDIPLEEQEGGAKTRVITWGHDIRFVYLLNKHGWPVYVDGRVFCAHLDIATGDMYRMPPDAPGFQVAEGSGNINTQEYWDKLYTQRGEDTWRKYPEMFGKVAKEVKHAVLELGCGVGVLADLISKKIDSKIVGYKGYDISQVAVNICKKKGHDVEQLDLKNLKPEMIDRWCIVATEVMEHLSEDDFYYVMNQIDFSDAKQFIFTVPDNCMGPLEVPEHTALFNEALVRERMKIYKNWTLKIESADAQHLICVMERIDGDVLGE